MKKPSLPVTLCVLTFLIYLLVHPPTSTASRNNTLSRGSSLFAGGDSNRVLVSPDTSYTCGFYSVGPNAYTFSIWVSHAEERTVVWTANRDHPVNGHGARVTMRKSGILVLKDADGTAVWRTNTSHTPANRVELLDTGNLVVMDPQDNSTLWQSFDYPTDTLLATQLMTKATKLVSSAPNESLASGFYTSYFDNDNVLKLIYYGKETSSIYWPNTYFPMWMSNRNTFNGTRLAVFDQMGQFMSSDNLTFKASDMGSGIMRRLTLDYDGNLRMHSLNKTTGTWSVAWEAIPQLCQVHGVCGKNGICTYSQLKPICSCPPYFDMVDPNDWSQGCKPKFEVTCNKSLMTFHELPRTDFWGYDRSSDSKASLKDCKQSCLVDCSCMGLLYKEGKGECYTKGDQFFNLFNGQTSPNNEGSIYLKVPKSTAPSLVRNHICSISQETDVHAAVYRRNGGSRVKWSYFYAFVSAFGVIELLFLISGWWLILRIGRRPTSLGEGYDIIPGQIRKFTYKELKKATGNFMHELGRGASGAAYKGALDDERTVAVKKLENMDLHGEEEFHAELNLIGRINHINLVRMLGFCAEGKHRLLVSEYVDNGALDRHLFDGGSTLGWRERYKIAIGIAKGLAYLHHECLEWVIHCDIKPENILLDSDFEAKIADFGLAKLTKRGAADRKTSRVRGTRGYMAPEWISNLPITSKVDVYSYGVLLLELVSGCRLSKWMPVEEGIIAACNIDLMSWIRTSLKVKLGADEEDKSWIGGFVDLKLDGKFDMKQAQVMFDVSISCLEVETSLRPTMDIIVHTLLSSDHE